MKRLFVGIDLGNEKSAICITDEAGNVLTQQFVEHSALAYGKFVDDLLDGVAPSSIRVAVEKPHGPLVELLLDRGVAVFSINPKQLDRFRDRFSMAGAKDDMRDALVAASSLRTDPNRFREVKLSDPRVIALRELGRAREEVLQQELADASRLREQLMRFYPCLLTLMDAEEPLLWSLLKRFPTPSDGLRARRSGVTAVMVTSRVRRFTAEDVVKALHQPPLHVAPGVVEAASGRVAMLIQRLEVAHDQVRTCDQKIARLLDEMEGDAPTDDAGGGGDAGSSSLEADVKILRSTPGGGNNVIAALLGEAAQVIIERDYLTARKLAGVAPVTKESGKHREVSMRRASNRRLRDALFNFARVNVQKDARSKQLYSDARSRGHSHGHALRIVGDRLLKVLFTMLGNGTMWNHSLRLKGAAA